MPLRKIKIENEVWEYDDTIHLGPPGGFGEVFLGKHQGKEIAVKRLKAEVTKFASRELKLAHELRNRHLEHVVPILAAGRDCEDNCCYIIMPRCEKSLKETIDSDSYAFDPESAAEVIQAVLFGLAEIPDITHRDLKPGNILRHNNKWKLADFGISKAVADSTSTLTLRRALTPAYAAPEQWRQERASQATDIYALGCLCHEIIAGQTPFMGSDDELENKHLNELPPTIDSIPARTSSFINQMLRKKSSARPNLKRCIDFFQDDVLQHDGRVLTNPLAAVAASIEHKEAKAEVEMTAIEVRLKGRRVIFQEALSELELIREKLFSSIEEVSESVRRSKRYEVNFGQSTMVFSETVSCVDDPILSSPEANQIHALRKSADWDVLGMTSMAVGYNIQNSYSHSANLMLAAAGSKDDFRWQEISFLGCLNNHHPRHLLL